MTKARVRAFSLVVGVVSWLGCAGGQGREPPPVASLAASRTAQQTFRAIRQDWATGPKADKAQLEAQLRSFLATFPDDGDAPLARAYLAFVLLDADKLDQAEAQIAGVLTGPPGTARDTAEVAEGAILLARHRAASAYDRLLPLVGKIIDPPLRIHFNRHIVRAAVESGRPYEALAFMDAWLRDAQIEDRAASERQVAQALVAVPADVLEVTLHSMERGDNGGGYGGAIRKAILARLAEVALERHDPALARKVVQSGATGSESLEDLALSGAPVVVEGHTIGLVLWTVAGWPSEASADVLLGAVEAVREGNQKPDERARLITRDLRDGGRLDLALMTLASQGASVLVAGLDAPQATVAAKFAELAKIPTILLTPPVEPVASDFAFVLGEAEQAVEGQLEQALRDRGVRRIATVRGSWGSPPRELGAQAQRGDARDDVDRTTWCARDSATVSDKRFPTGAWKEARVDGLLLLADAQCARDAIGEAKKLTRSNLVAALGLHGAQIALTPPRSTALLVASAGRFPLLASDVASPLEASRQHQGEPPSWLTAIGHDAAALARAALRGLPMNRTDEASSVVKLHQQVKESLAVAQANLWTTDAKGFSGQHALSRVVRIRELPE